MLRKILIILVMTPLIIAAASSDTSFPVLLMMISLLLIALLESSSRNEQLDSATSEDSDWTTADNNTIPEKYMKSLSNCESTAAADGHLTLVEIMDCFYQVF